MNYKTKMSQIGKIMDKLASRGLIISMGALHTGTIINVGNIEGIIGFNESKFVISMGHWGSYHYSEYHFSNPNWQKELLAKVDELLGVKK